MACHGVKTVSSESRFVWAQPSTNKPTSSQVPKNMVNRWCRQPMTPLPETRQVVASEAIMPVLPSELLPPSVRTSRHSVVRPGVYRVSDDGRNLRYDGGLSAPPGCT